MNTAIVSTLENRKNMVNSVRNQMNEFCSNCSGTWFNSILHFSGGNLKEYEWACCNECYEETIKKRKLNE